MLLKSLVMSAVAAVLGPTLGIGLFFVANGDFGNQTTSFAASTGEAALVTEQRDTDVIRMFAPPGAWYNPTSTGEHERKINTAAGDPLSKLGSWHTVVSCPEDRALSEDGRCTSPHRPDTKQQVLR